MNQQQPSFGIERRLTPALYEYYVSNARAERSKAIAAFLGNAVAWLSSLAGRIHARDGAEHRSMPSES